MPEEPAIQRQDVLAIVDALVGIRTDLQEVVQLLKRKRARERSPEERAADKARAEEQIRKLREVVAKIEAELESEESGQ